MQSSLETLLLILIITIKWRNNNPPFIGKETGREIVNLRFKLKSSVFQSVFSNGSQLQSHTQTGASNVGVISNRQHKVMAEHVDYGAKLPGFESWLCHFPSFVTLDMSLNEL